MTTKADRAGQPLTAVIIDGSFGSDLNSRSFIHTQLVQVAGRSSPLNPGILIIIEWRRLTERKKGDAQ